MYSPEGFAIGNWELFAKANKSIFAKGKYINGLPDGLWTLWDTGGTKNAEFLFANGKLHGEYRLFYSSFTPEVSGKLKTIGSAYEGILEGTFKRYNPDGSTLVEYTAKSESVVNVSTGDRYTATKQLSADRRYIDLLVETIIAVPQRQSENKKANK
ncbi:MAG: hypothetical protein HUJ29_10760 [Gammaproteobacteria bacterium]|nr:hypothetical protein [Gammaproteobacteria bacterium]